MDKPTPAVFNAVAMLLVVVSSFAIASKRLVADGFVER